MSGGVRRSKKKSIKKVSVKVETSPKASIHQSPSDDEYTSDNDRMVICEERPDGGEVQFGLLKLKLTLLSLRYNL